jgi:uncharacterized membrane protein
MDGEQKKSLAKKIIVGILMVIGVLALLVLGVIVFVANQATHMNFGTGSDSIGVTSETSSVQNAGVAFSNPLSYSPGAGGMRKSAVSESAPSAPLSAPSGDLSSAQDRKIIRAGSLSVRVADADAAVGKIRDIAAAQGGFVSDILLYGAIRGSKNGTLSVSVPSDRLDQAMAAIKQAASLVMSETVSGNDVTEAYIDLDARIKSRVAEEQAYQDLLGRAQKMSDIIEITQALSTVRGEIESMNGQKRYYDSRTTMATITVSLSEDLAAAVPADDGFRPWQTVKDSAHRLALFLEDFVLGLINFVIVLIPVLLLIGLVAFLVILALFRLGRWLVRRYFSAGNGQ